MVRIPKALLGGILFTALGMPLCSAAALDNMVVIESKLTAASEVPPNTSAGQGMLEATFNKETSILSYSVTYSDMTGPVKAGHFHGPAAAGSNAGVVVPFAAGMESPIKGTAVLTPAQAADLLAGKWYVNLHTAAHGGGEVRGQAMVK
jgi:hypothetical protein